MSHRKTDDLDLVVAVPLEDFPGPMKSLPGWRSHPKKEHCFFSPDGQQVDLVPAGAALVAQGYVEWPSGARMSLAGFDLAFAHATRELAGSTAVLVPPAPVIALLKMRAWLDRPHIREKDLADMHIFSSSTSATTMYGISRRSTSSTSVLSSRRYHRSY